MPHRSSIFEHVHWRRTPCRLSGWRGEEAWVLFFRLSTWQLTVVLLAVIVGATLVGLILGHAARNKSESFREPFSVLQAALLGFMGLVLAFGLSLAVGRYETRRTAVVDEANAIGTSYLRAQLIAEPQRSQSLALLKRFTETSIDISRKVPGSSAQSKEIATSGAIQRQLWGVAGQSLHRSPDSVDRLYVESLNQMFVAQSTRTASLANRVPTPVLLLEIVGASIALAALALHLATMGGRGVFAVLIAALLVFVILLVTFDLDRPTRGLIRVPLAPLLQERASMELPPAATPTR